jgi:hypothetical protein
MQVANADGITNHSERFAGSNPVPCTMEGQPDKRTGTILKIVGTAEPFWGQDLGFPPSERIWLSHI